MDDLKSQKSYASKAHSRKPSQKALSQKPQDDKSSVITKSEVPPQESDSELEEEDEWTAIQKFNALLHFEEQK